MFQNVRLESDMEDRDDYNRLLRYVFVDDISVNLWLVEEGYAHVFRESGLKYENQLKEAETNARLQKLGIWEKSRYSGHIILLIFNTMQKAMMMKTSTMNMSFFKISEMLH